MRSARVRLTVGAAIGCATILVLALGVASGAPDMSRAVIKSKLKITSINPDEVKGFVESKQKSCEKGRNVILLYSAPGVPTDQEQVIGTDKTDRKGNWKIPGSYSVGHYHAVAPKEPARARLEGKLEDELEEEEEDLARGNGGPPDCEDTTDTTVE